MRKPRKLKKDAIYHVIATINRYENILKHDNIKFLFLEIIKQAKKKYKFSIKNFCLMDNHIQFIIQPKEKSSLSKIMQWILSVFAISYNKIYHLKGHVWYDRFKSEIIDNIEQFISIFNYIIYYPVIMKKVTNPKDYKFGGFYYIMKGIFNIIDLST